MGRKKVVLSVCAGNWKIIISVVSIGGKGEENNEIR